MPGRLWVLVLVMALEVGHVRMAGRSLVGAAGGAVGQRPMACSSKWRGIDGILYPLFFRFGGYMRTRVQRGNLVICTQFSSVVVKKLYLEDEPATTVEIISLNQRMGIRASVISSSSVSKAGLLAPSFLNI